PTADQSSDSSEIQNQDTSGQRPAAVPDTNLRPRSVDDSGPIDTSSETSESAREVSADDLRDAFNLSINTELGSSYARSYDRARATIAADPTFQTATAVLDRAGDPGFKERLASIMADLEHNRQAALDAITDEIFSSALRARTNSSGPDAI